MEIKILKIKKFKKINRWDPAFHFYKFEKLRDLKSIISDIERNHGEGEILKNDFKKDIEDLKTRI